ncbi:Flagellum-specific peptidoglycan hydrolase FlgJ [Arachidicoccus rhizosphaerae]|uniref:Flagellum-specific peptidoglycan hydrolase FlgJ n=1 Tax=Arachidicoccus rhizosphaerae TaxID=551991 RepID=A0A1H4BSC1_9BACT|nr:glucosaminidase domain-containing protein [Arachidicoccus rhizosphaerae]SEA51045.1 Flagellum-specific peptidoglycan hydrolase FlgJ [Arachidicoccus rhizosphaerae]
MRKYALLLSMTLGTLAFNAVKAQTRSPQVEAYIQQYQALAVSEMMRTGVPASITLAQGILESGCGQSTLAKSSNNHFGIKCKTEWTGAKTYHDDDKKGECFRVYNSVEDSYKDHSDFLKNRPYYTDLFELNPTDYKAWAYGLKKDGYATERDYPQNLIKLIETYNLESYTDLAITKLKNGEQPYQDENSRIAFNNNQAQQGRPASPTGNRANQQDEDQKPGNNNSLAALNDNTSFATTNRSSAPAMRVAQTMVQGPSYPVAPFSINHSKVIYAPKGMSLMALASKNNINFHKLLTLNDLGPTAVVSPGQLIYLEKRPKKGEKEYVNSKYGQTLKEIAAEQGVALKSLVGYNKVAAETPLAAGQKVYLREKSNEAPKTLSK